METTIETTEKMHRSYLPLLALTLLVLSVLCRGMGYIYSIMATDIAYSDIVVSIMGILVEALTITRTVTGFVGILYAMHRWERNSPYRCGGRTLLVVLGCEILDCASRYLVDEVTSSITDLELFALLWLSLQLCYSAVLDTVIWCGGKFWFHPIGKRAAVPLERTVTTSTLILLGTRLVLEIYYLVDFLITYTNITSTEVSSIVGQFLYTLVLYGGVAWGIGMGMTKLARGKFDRR